MDTARAADMSSVSLPPSSCLEHGTAQTPFSHYSPPAHIKTSLMGILISCFSLSFFFFLLISAGFGPHWEQSPLHSLAMYLLYQHTSYTKPHAGTLTKQLDMLYKLSPTSFQSKMEKQNGRGLAQRGHNNWNAFHSSNRGIFNTYQQLEAFRKTRES